MIRPVLTRMVPCLAVLLAIAASPLRADDPAPGQSLPLTTPGGIGSYEGTISQPLTIAQQRARFDADQRMLRMQYNKWIGYEPLRPAMPNALTNNEWNPHYMHPVRYRPVWGVWNYGSRIW